MLIGRKRRAGQQMFALLVLIAGLCCSLIPRFSFGADWSGVPPRDNRGTVLIHTNWVDREGHQSGTATGFVISKEGHILTVAHQFPKDNPTILITGETEGWPSSYQRQNFPLKLGPIDRDADFAILTPAKNPVLVPLPTFWEWEPLEGAEVNARGFPLGGLLEGMEGKIRRSGSSPEVPMGVWVRGGYSGAPVYDSLGRVVCMIRGGTAVADIEDPTIMGLGFCVPLSLLRQKVPTDIMTAVVNAGLQAETGVRGRIRVSYSVDTTKETIFTGLQDLVKPASTESYTTGRLEATSGYRIVNYEYLEHSGTKVSDRQVKIAPDGSYLEMTYKLTSGPGFDRYRGWLAATIITIQEPKGKP